MKEFVTSITNLHKPPKIADQMERVGILINKLQEQLQYGADAQKMLVTAQMLYTELLQEREKMNGRYASNIMVSAVGNPPPPVTVTVETAVETVRPADSISEEKQFIEEIGDTEEKPFVEEIRVIEEKPIVEEIAAASPQVTEEKMKADFPFEFVYNVNQEVKQSTRWGMDPVDIPTLAQQEKVLYSLEEHGDDSSLNDKLKEEKVELGSILQETPIRDLKKAISINDRHRFIESLFRGDETMYERSIKTINNFSIYAEAEFWIQRELKLKLGWNNSLPEVRLFDQLVKRRFS